MAEGPSSAEASRLAGGEDLAEFTELDLTGEEYAGAGSRGYVNVSMDIQARTPSHDVVVWRLERIRGAINSDNDCKCIWLLKSNTGNEFVEAVKVLLE